MGSCLSLAQNNPDIVKKALGLLGLDLNFKKEEWQEIHNQGTFEENTSTLAKLGVDLTKSKPTGLKKAVFLCCNTYTKPELALGVGPLNDAATVGGYLMKKGFTVLYAHNPKAQQFLDMLTHCIKNTSEYLLVYYTGHGASVKDLDGDEEDRMDEAMVFDDTHVIDDKLMQTLVGAGKPPSSKVCLMNDCCHSGTIWDLKPGIGQPDNVMCLSAAKDAQTAKQTKVDGAEQGIFTFYFFKLLTQKEKMTPAEMESQINPYIQKYDQEFTKSATTPSMLNDPIFT
jgi:hypothetical protein